MSRDDRRRPPTPAEVAALAMLYGPPVELSPPVANDRELSQDDSGGPPDARP